MSAEMISRNIYSVYLALLFFGYPVAAGISEIFLKTESSIAAISLWLLITAMGIFLVLKEFMIGNVTLNTKIGIPVLLFLILYFFNLTFDLYISNIVSFMEKNEYVIRFIVFVYFPCFVLMVSTLRFQQSEKLLSFFFITLIVGFILNAVAMIMDIPQALMSGGGEARASTDKLNPVSYGYLCSTLALLILFRRIHLGKKSIYSNCLLVLAILGVLIAGSKGPILGFIVALLYMYIRFVGVNRKFVKNIFFIALLASIVTAGLILYLDINPFARFERIFDDGETSSVYRIISAMNALEIFSSGPIWGGSSFLRTGGYPHNLFLEILMATGVVGFGLIVFAVINALRSRHSVNFSSCNFYCIFLVHELCSVLTSGAIYSSGNLFFTVLIISSISRSRSQNVKRYGSNY
jgi:O-antigen ligase